MVGTIKMDISKNLHNEDFCRMQDIPQILCGYRFLRIAGDLSPLQLMYGVAPRISSRDPSPLHEYPPDNDAYSMDLL